MLNAVFDDVGGLMKGGNIWFSGVKVGTIKKISFYGDSKVLVAMSIELDVQSHIHKDAKAKIGSDGLIGNKIIVLSGGDSSKPQVEKNDFLEVENTLGTSEMMATLQANNKNLLEITNDFKSISKKIDSGKGSLAILLNDPAIANKLNSTVENLQATVANFKTVSLSTQSAITNIEDFTHKLNKKGTSINGLVTDTIVYSSVKETLVQLQNAANSVSLFTANLEKVSDRLSKGDNAVGTLLNDPEAAKSIKTTLKNLESGSKKLDEDLEALQHNILLKRYFKKKDKAKAQ